MRARRFVSWLIPVALVGFAIGALAMHRDKQQNQAPDASRLGTEDKSQIAEALRLQRELGDRVWPGLAAAEVPIILYHGTREFLVGMSDPPGPWAVVEGDTFGGKPYHWRPAVRSQAFAVRVGDAWAGSVGTLEFMNRTTPMKTARDIHVVFVLHELFHAFQARQAPDRFAGATKVYSAEAGYPAKQARFAADWDKEGGLLASALKAVERPAARQAAGAFLKARDERRARAALSPDALAFERELEWLEGLAKYVEVQFYELAAEHSGEPSYSSYRPNLLYWRLDLFRLEKQMGQQGGDLRFYLSGMAEARLLDVLRPRWKAEAMRRETYLDELLRDAVKGG